MSRVFFTADTHLGHSGILRHCPETRQFKDIKQHDRAVVQNWNAVVGRNDTVYHLGDVAWCSDEVNKLLKQLNGSKILIPGNHDEKSLRNKSFRDIWDHICPSPYHEVYIKETRVVLCHYPIWEWNGMFGGAWHLFGHVHGRPTGIPGKNLDVGVDTNQMFPYSVEQITKIMSEKDIATSQPRKSL